MVGEPLRGMELQEKKNKKIKTEQGKLFRRNVIIKGVC